ncbi:MAG TPA: hypothetical protein VF269_07620 [Rhodanobacteraceae bacterium]
MYMTNLPDSTMMVVRSASLLRTQHAPNVNFQSIASKRQAPMPKDMDGDDHAHGEEGVGQYSLLTAPTTSRMLKKQQPVARATGQGQER